MHSEYELIEAITVQPEADALELLRGMLEAGAEFDAFRGEGIAFGSIGALSNAAMWGSAEMVRLLLEHDAPPRLRHRYEIAPLTIAACYATLKAVDLLLDAGASWEELSSSALQDRNAELLNAPLCGPAMLGKGARVIELLRRGAAPVVNNMEDSGRAALHWAADIGDLATAEALITAGADVNLHCETTGGKSPLDAAVFGGHPEMMLSLLSHGADPDRPTWLGRSIRERMREGDPDIDPLVRERFENPSLNRRAPGRSDSGAGARP